MDSLKGCGRNSRKFCALVVIAPCIYCSTGCWLGSEFRKVFAGILKRGLDKGLEGADAGLLSHSNMVTKAKSPNFLEVAHLKNLKQRSSICILKSWKLGDFLGVKSNDSALAQYTRTYNTRIWLWPHKWLPQFDIFKPFIFLS